VTVAVRREDLARSIADAVTEVPGVAALTSADSSVEVATLFAGGKVVGLRLGEDTIEIHIVVNRVPVQPVANEAVAAARRVLSAIGDDRPVRVVVADIALDTLDRRDHPKNC
jgi:hypothetical protein